MFAFTISHQLLTACRFAHQVFAEFPSIFDALRFNKNLDRIRFDQFCSEQFRHVIFALEQSDADHEALPAFLRLMRFARLAHDHPHFRSRVYFEKYCGDPATFEAITRDFAREAEEHGVRLF